MKKCQYTVLVHTATKKHWYHIFESRDLWENCHKIEQQYHKIWQNFWVTVCKTVRALLSVRCLSCASVCL